MSREEMEMFDAACADPKNEFAQELLNVFGAEKAIQILDHMPTVPLGLLVDVVSHLWRAMNHEASRRGAETFQFEFAE
jgi:hypothetical protein